MRVGVGFDAHPLVDGRPLVLGGVRVPYERGLEGHSDADVVLHALIDAMLGAAALGDIGAHFPSSDPAYKGIASTELLRRTAELLRQRGWQVSNADATIIAERPKLAAYIASMREATASVLSVEPSRVSIKATTTNGLGFAGRGEGIAAIAVVTIEEVAS
ncbi:MAG: 2-C-methyl-D-erythritol 2,4-cyclodiphosphate synthase [Chloroflexi bacterium]|nr:2-C-methyl-D-erythritol 2,4-cyclodiphosphate synthase [Chloroflexota bacterium]